MSDMKRTKRERRAPTRDVARHLELQAIEEQFLSEWRAGLRPQLSAYLRRYPSFNAELAAFIALTFIPAGQSGVLLLADGDAPSHEHRAGLSSGTRRALEEIFGGDVGEAASQRSRVAERRAGYGDVDARRPPAKDQNSQGQG